MAVDDHGSETSELHHDPVAGQARDAMKGTITGSASTSLDLDRPEFDPLHVEIVGSNAQQPIGGPFAGFVGSWELKTAGDLASFETQPGLCRVGRDWIDTYPNPPGDIVGKIRNRWEDLCDRHLGHLLTNGLMLLFGHPCQPALQILIDVLGGHSARRPVPCDSLGPSFRPYVDYGRVAFGPVNSAMTRGERPPRTERRRTGEANRLIDPLGGPLTERDERVLFIFLLAFLVYNDGVGTIIKMATVYGSEVGIAGGQLIGALILVQFLGIPFTFAFGQLASRIGARTGIYVCLVVYTAIAILGFFMSTAWHFWALAVGIATVQGGVQGLSRSVYASMIPLGRSTEFFGFYSVSSKFAGILGPLVFAVVGQSMSGSRYGILSLVVFFIVGGILLGRADIGAGQALARAEEAEMRLRAGGT